MLAQLQQESDTHPMQCEIECRAFTSGATAASMKTQMELRGLVDAIAAGTLDGD